MCDELANRKESVLVFICYIGNKDTSAMYPKSMRVNRRNVIEALLWLKIDNPHYRDVTINESNLDWMKDKDEANIGQEGEILSTKDTQRYKVLSVGILPDGYVRTNPLPQIPTKQSVSPSKDSLLGYYRIPQAIPTLHSLIGPAIDKVRIPWLSFH